jgi:hypothetical protein
MQVDGCLCLCDSLPTMWIRRAYPLLARMPSTRAQAAPAPATAVPAQRKPTDLRKQAAPSLPPRDPPSDEGEEREGGFHESSYELRTGMDVFESEWPEDVTIPGALDDE